MSTRRDSLGNVQSPMVLAHMLSYLEACLMRIRLYVLVSAAWWRTPRFWSPRPGPFVAAPALTKRMSLRCSTGSYPLLSLAVSCHVHELP